MICKRTVKKYCKDFTKIENYEKAIADDTQLWEVHHRREELYSYAELIKRGEYFDVEPKELIFLTREEHRKMDSMHKRQSKTLKGKPSNNRRKVLCVETHIIYESTIEAEKSTGTNHSNISAVCKGKHKTAGGYHWQYA